MKKKSQFGFLFAKDSYDPFSSKKKKKKKPYSLDLNLIELALYDIDIYCLKNAHTIIHRSNCPLG